MILPAQDIRSRAMVAPHHERSVIRGMSYGLSAAGYDVRIAQDVTLWPGRFVLASTIERLDMPGDVLATVADKSTWARRGVAVQNTIIEPGWRGYLTIELTMHAWRVLRIRAGDPIAQIIFHQLAAATVAPYRGKYQDQPPRPVAAKGEVG